MTNPDIVHKYRWMYHRDNHFMGRTLSNLIARIVSEDRARQLTVRFDIFETTKTANFYVSQIRLVFPGLSNVEATHRLPLLEVYEGQGIFKEDLFCSVTEAHLGTDDRSVPAQGGNVYNVKFSELPDVAQKVVEFLKNY